MASNRSKRPRLGLVLGLGLPIVPFGTCATLGLNLYKLSHEVVRRLNLRPFRAIWVLRGVLSERSAGHVRTRTRAAQIVHVMRDAYIYMHKSPLPFTAGCIYICTPDLLYFRVSSYLLCILPRFLLLSSASTSFAIHALNTMGAARLL